PAAGRRLLEPPLPRAAAAAGSAVTAPGLGAAFLLLAAAPPREAVRRPIVPPQAGVLAAPLDRDVYDRARADLGDLRVIDDRDATVPFLLDWAVPRPPGTALTPRLVDRGFVRGESATVTLDFGGPVRKRELQL